MIPYTISLIIAGIPIFYFELIIGQFSSLGPIGIFKRVVPISQGKTNKNPFEVLIPHVSYYTVESSLTVLEGLMGRLCSRFYV